MIQTSDKRNAAAGGPNNGAIFSANTTAYNANNNEQFFDKEVPLGKEYERVTFFDRSNALGFSEDKLGRLAEINKT